VSASVTIVGPPDNFPPLNEITGEGAAEACPIVDALEVVFVPSAYLEL
jgi:hypothetical protein